MAIDEFTNTGVMRNVFTSSPDKSLGYLLTRVYGLRQKKMNEELAPLGLNYVQYNLLAGLYWLQMNGETVNQMTLINFTKLDKSVVSSILRKFTNDAYVSRVEGTEDTRAKIVTLTAKGKGLTEKAIKIINYIDCLLYK
mgnify:FL=1